MNMIVFRKLDRPIVQAESCRALPLRVPPHFEDTRRESCSHGKTGRRLSTTSPIWPNHHQSIARPKQTYIFRSRAYLFPTHTKGQHDSKVVRIGRPLILGERWMSWEAATAGFVLCGVVGMILGIRAGARSPRGCETARKGRSDERDMRDN